MRVVHTARQFGGGRRANHSLFPPFPFSVQIGTMPVITLLEIYGWMYAELGAV